ncbi:hypothetical protein RND81_03G213600 [Saponaria officinalis]|uniref:WRKY domain-containing protein n=1 Tax=Saponaria officinalis TaxID=3572 RepID=A0AAW1M1T0_SAPOF
MEGPPDWDLLAVVRSCSSTTTTATTTAPAPDLHPSPPQPPPPLPPPPPPQQELCFSPTPSTCTSSSVLFGFSSPLTTTSFLSTGGFNDLQDICNKPFICNMNTSNSFNSFSCSSLTSPISSPSLLSSSSQQFRHVVKPSQVIFGGSSTNSTTTTTSQSQRAKKRKNLMKKVCHVPAEGLSSDMWAWRKYGQKPIKGSPYPRGYYRCSSSKGCLARKQVERNRTDPKMFIVTYTSEHNHPMPTHRNSLAGSTRQKTTSTPSEHPPCSSPSATTTAALSPLTEPSESKTEGDDMTKDEYDDDDMRELSDLMLNDDFYVGFEQIDGGSDDSDCFSEQFSPSSSEFPWLSNGGSTATAAGGS